MKYHLIPTLDYEVFGNGSGCLKNCLTEPAKHCLEVTEQYSANQTFFVDTSEFHSIKKEIAAGRVTTEMAMHYEGVEEQLLGLAKTGHFIELHLHPQWLNAMINNGTWQLDFSKWRIGDLTTDEMTVCFAEGLGYLQNLLGNSANANCKTFRAGGWALQPSEIVIEHLLANRIAMDSTVAPGVYNRAGGDWYDFKQAPKDKPYWQVLNNVCQENTKGKLLEVPIATAQIGRSAHIKALKSHRSHPPLPHNCIGDYAGPNNRVQAIFGKLSKLMNIGTVMLDFSTLPAWTLIEATQRYMDKFSNHNGPIPIVAIGHNKNFTDWSAENLNNYLSWVDAQPDMCFSNYQDWHSALQVA